MLSQRSPLRVAEAIHKALDNRGYDPKLIETAVERVRQQLLDEAHGDGP
jgi:hypothetical protein